MRLINGQWTPDPDSPEAKSLQAIAQREKQIAAPKKSKAKKPAADQQPDTKQGDQDLEKEILKDLIELGILDLIKL